LGVKYWNDFYRHSFSTNPAIIFYFTWTWNWCIACSLFWKGMSRNNIFRLSIRPFNFFKMSTWPFSGVMNPQKKKSKGDKGKKRDPDEEAIEYLKRDIEAEQNDKQNVEYNNDELERRYCNIILLSLKALPHLNVSI